MFFPSPYFWLTDLVFGDLAELKHSASKEDENAPQLESEQLKTKDHYPFLEVMKLAVSSSSNWHDLFK